MSHLEASGGQRMKPPARFGREGAIVVGGGRVRLLAIRPPILKHLVGDQDSDVSGMFGQVVEVLDVYDTGQIWVSASFQRKKSGTAEVYANADDAEVIGLFQKTTPPQ